MFVIVVALGISLKKPCVNQKRAPPTPMMTGQDIAVVAGLQSANHITPTAPRWESKR